MALIGAPADWSASDQQGVLRDALIGAYNGSVAHTPKECAICAKAARSLVSTLGEGALRFYRNPTASEREMGLKGRVELPRGKARFDRLRWKVAEVHAYMDAGIFDPGPAPVAAPVAPAPIVSEPAPIGFDPDAEKRFFWSEYERIQTLAHREGFDSLKYRPAQDAGRMISAGIPAVACLHAMALHWEDADRRRAGIQKYDPATDFPGGLDAYMDALAASGVLIMLVGPAGVGKSFWAKNLADRLGVDFGAISMTEGASPSWLLGRITMDGYKPSRFVDLFQRPSVFLMDELDAADANMALVINDPLANGILDNPVSGDLIRRDPQNIIVATANTLGSGADDDYAGRNQLDFATLDRFRMGRVFVDYNRDVARSLLFA